MKDFPGGAEVKNLPANAGSMGSIPGPGRSHVLQGNYTYSTTTEPTCPRAHLLCNKRSHHTASIEMLTLTATREGPEAAKKPSSAKIN